MIVNHHPPRTRADCGAAISRAGALPGGPVWIVFLVALPAALATVSVSAAQRPMGGCTAFMASTVTVTTSAQKLSGRFARREDCSTWSEVTPQSQTSTTVTIRNARARRMWTKNSRNRWFTAPVNSPEYFRARTLEDFVRPHVTSEPTTYQGKPGVRVMNGRDGSVQTLLPVLNYFPVEMVSRRLTHRLANIVIAAPDDKLFIVPANVAVFEFRSVAEMSTALRNSR